MTSTPPSNGGGVPSPRRSGNDAAAREGHASHGDNESPGVPIFRSWRGVYVFVFACFVLTVIALTIFTAAFE